jgi:hypothetical protein
MCDSLCFILLLSPLSTFTWVTYFGWVNQHSEALDALKQVKEWAEKEQELSLVIEHCNTRAGEIQASDETLQARRKEASAATLSAEQRLEVAVERLKVIEFTLAHAIGRRLKEGESASTAAKEDGGEAADGAMDQETQEGGSGDVRQQAAAKILQILKESADSFKTQWAGVRVSSE